MSVATFEEHLNFPWENDKKIDNNIQFNNYFIYFQNKIVAP